MDGVREREAKQYWFDSLAVGKLKGSCRERRYSDSYFILERRKLSLLSLD
jgi:hypothetical protein